MTLIDADDNGNDWASTFYGTAVGLHT